MPGVDLSIDKNSFSNSKKLKIGEKKLDKEKLTQINQKKIEIER